MSGDVLGRPRPSTPTAVPPSRPPTLDTITAQLSVSRPEDFYAEADAYDRVTAALRDQLDRFGSQVRGLDEVWRGAGSTGFAELARQVSGGIDRLNQALRQPDNAQLLRRTGDMLADAQRRLRDLRTQRDGSAVRPNVSGVRSADPSFDQRAAQVLAGLGQSYLDIVRGLGPLPEATVAGRPVWFLAVPSPLSPDVDAGTVTVLNGGGAFPSGAFPSGVVATEPAGVGVRRLRGFAEAPGVLLGAVDGGVTTVAGAVGGPVDAPAGDLAGMVTLGLVVPGEDSRPGVPGPAAAPDGVELSAAVQLSGGVLGAPRALVFRGSTDSTTTTGPQDPGAVTEGSGSAGVLVVAGVLRPSGTRDESTTADTPPAPARFSPLALAQHPALPTVATGPATPAAGPAASPPSTVAAGPPAGPPAPAGHPTHIPMAAKVTADATTPNPTSAPPTENPAVATTATVQPGAITATTGPTASNTVVATPPSPSTPQAPTTIAAEQTVSVAAPAAPAGPGPATPPVGALPAAAIGAGGPARFDAATPATPSNPAAGQQNTPAGAGGMPMLGGAGGAVGAHTPDRQRLVLSPADADEWHSAGLAGVPRGFGRPDPAPVSGTEPAQGGHHNGGDPGPVLADRHRPR